MALLVKHLKVSAKGDGADPSLIQPSNWNADHVLTGFGDAAAKNTGTSAGTLAAGDHTHAGAVAAGASGFLTGADKTKLDGITAGAVASFAALTGKPTTIVGYGITNAYTKTEVDAAIAAAIAANIFAGGVIQSGLGTLGTSSIFATHIPFDDTVPQITEGSEIITVTLTPKSVTNKFRVRFYVPLNIDASAQGMAAVFHNATAAALYATSGMSTPNGGVMGILSGEFEYVPGVLTSEVVRLRIGSDTSNMYPNGLFSGRKLGGASLATMTVEEIKV